MQCPVLTLTECFEITPTPALGPQKHDTSTSNNFSFCFWLKNKETQLSGSYICWTGYLKHSFKDCVFKCVVITIVNGVILYFSVDGKNNLLCGFLSLQPIDYTPILLWELLTDTNQILSKAARVQGVERHSYFTLSSLILVTSCKHCSSNF